MKYLVYLAVWVVLMGSTLISGMMLLYPELNWVAHSRWAMALFVLLVGSWVSAKVVKKALE